jgi:hypothetical protein
MLTVKVGVAEFERDLIRTRTGEGCARHGERREAWQEADSDASSAGRDDQASRWGRLNSGLDRPRLQCQRGDDFEVAFNCRFRAGASEL